MKLINSAATCSINKFITCKFKNDLSVLIVQGEPLGHELFEAWDQIHTEFIDLSGAEIEEIHITAGVHVLELRNKAVELFLLLQRQSLELLGEPHFPAMEQLVKYGYKLQWRSDKENFLQQIDAVELSEAKYKTRLINKEKELQQHREQIKENPPPTQDEGKFYDLLNALQRPPFEYRVDYEMPVAPLARMIKQYGEWVDKQPQHQ
jgi:hypothetical protein